MHYFKKSFIYLFVTLMFLSGSIKYACGDSPQKKLPNILFITIDTIRADHVGCYGYKSVKTPNIDGLAKEGILFSNTYSPIPLTLPSHITIFTGQYPNQHGIRNNCAFELQDSAKTLAEIFKTLGYKTGAIVASYVLAAHFGLNQGFDDYDDYFFQQDKDMSDYNENFRTGGDVTERAKRWLQKDHKAPFFLWVHYFDPHTPYNPPAPFDKLYDGRPYDGEIAFTDKCLGDLLEELKRLSLSDNTCIIVVGDHGEGLWEHNEETHGLFIYNTTLQVPFIMNFPKALPKGKVIEPLVRTIDIMPTILELLAIKPEDTHLQGVSLLPFIRNDKKVLELDLYCESYYPKFNFNWAPLEGILTADGWKYIHVPKRELYNLKCDPNEIKNLFSTNPKKADALYEKLSALEKVLLKNAQSQDMAQMISISPEDRERFRSLGYVSYSGSDSETMDEDSNLKLPDPKDKAHVLIMLDRARDMEGNAEIDRAIQQYEKVLKEDTENKTALFSVGQLYRNTGQPEKAMHKLEKLNDLDPQNFDCKNSLGLIYDILGMPDKAVEMFKEAINVNSKIPYIHHNLGKTYLKINALDLAAEQFRIMQSLTNDPVVISMAIGNLGGIDAIRGDTEKAIEKFKESLAHNIANRDARISLVDAYYHLGNLDQAINELKAIIDYWQDDFISYYRLAQLLLEADKPDEAVEYLRKCIRLCPDYIDARILLDRIRHDPAIGEF